MNNPKYPLLTKILSEAAEEAEAAAALPVNKANLIPEIKDMIPHGNLDSVKMDPDPTKPKLFLIMKDSLMLLELEQKLKDRFVGIRPVDAQKVMLQIELRPEEAKKQQELEKKMGFTPV